MSKILWIDDDINKPELRSDLEALKDHGHEITTISSISGFIELIDRTRCQTEYCCIIIDMMIPPEKVFDLKESDYGARTGFLLIDKIMRNRFFKKTKIVVYSIVDDMSIYEECCNMKIPYLCKTELLSNDFVSEIEKIINTKSR